MWSGIGKSGTLQLYSVGHVNHSAIYIAIMLGVAAAWLFAGYRRWSAGMRLAALLVPAALFLSLLVTASRGAFAAGIIVLVVLAAAWWRRWRAPAIAVAVATLALVAAAFALNLEIVAKQERYEAADAEFSLRDRIWRVGLEAWERHPWFGVGMDNYAKVGLEDVAAWRKADGETFDPSRYVVWSHGHSLFVNTIAERGVVGSAPLAAVLLAWLAGLARRRPGPEADEVEWAVWGASASALTVTVAAGLVNTSLHHEHGILAALLLGLWAGRARRAPPPA
jgi:O-antigen ligase